jgi:hypothetical protein
MADTLYTTGRQGILDGSISVSTANVKCLLANSNYHPNPATDNFVSTIGNPSIVARSGNFTGKSVTGGVFSADHVIFPALSGQAVFYIVIYVDTGTDTTSRLIVFFDTALGVPFTPNGGNVELAWDTNGIFRV